MSSYIHPDVNPNIIRDTKLLIEDTRGHRQGFPRLLDHLLKG